MSVKEVIRRCWVSGESASLSVMAHPDGGDFVRLSTMRNKESAVYFGEVDITMPASFARILGEALIESAQEAEKR